MTEVNGSLTDEKGEGALASGFISEEGLKRAS
jgi:hypothetical protein